MSTDGDYSGSWQQSRSQPRAACHPADLYNWCGDQKQEQSETDRSAALINSLSDQDFYRWSGAENDKRCADLPDTRIDHSQEAQIATLSDTEARAEEKLKAADALVKEGVTNFNIVDENGKERHVRLEREQCEGKQLLHMFADDDCGRERVLLRAVCNGNGTYSQERNKHGRHVSFYGSWWTTNMSHRDRSHRATSAANENVE